MFLQKVKQRYKVTGNADSIGGQYGSVVETGEGFIVVQNYKHSALYHGSSTPVQNFKVGLGKGRFGGGLYLTPNSDTANFYSKGGRQGNAGQKLDKNGTVYQFEVNASVALIVTNGDEFSRWVVSEDEDAEKDWDAIREFDSAKITKHWTRFAKDSYNADVLVYAEEGGVLTPFPQVIILNDRAVKRKAEGRYELIASHPFPSSTLKDPVYHGTTRSFKEFQKRKSTRYVLFTEVHVDSQGFFFAEDLEEARKYVGGDGFGKSNRGWIVECYLDLKNPLLDPRKYKHLGVDKLPEALEKDVVEILSEAIEGTGDDRKITLMLTTVYPDNPKYEDSDWIYEMISSGGLFWDITDNPKVVKKMQALGYDGTFVHEDNHDNGRSIFVPNEKQIKIVKWLDAIEEEEE